MIKVFYGEDRVRAKEAIQKFLGNEYEVAEGEDLKINDLPSLFYGGTLFADKRAIMIRDLGMNKEVFERLVDYRDTSNLVAVFETTVDKRSSVYKSLKDEILFLEFKQPKDLKAGMVFDIFWVAKRDGKKAVMMLEEIQHDQDPMMFIGLLATQAIKDYEKRSGDKEKRVLLELSALDMRLKTSKIEPWSLIKSFLLKIKLV